MKTTMKNALTGSRFRLLWLLLLIWLMTQPAHAADVRVDYYEGDFYLTLEFQSTMPPDEVMAMLTDYSRLNRINPTIRESAVVGESSPDKTVVWKKLNGCFLMVCREVHHTEHVTVTADEILMITIPERSDFKMGKAHWKVMPGASGSMIKYYASIKPSFRMPAFLGRWYVRHKMIRELKVTARALGDVDAVD